MLLLYQTLLIVRGWLCLYLETEYQATVLYFHRDNEVVGHFVPVMLNLPSSCHIAVRHSSIKLVGELAEWIEKHPDYLGKYRMRK